MPKERDKLQANGEEQLAALPPSKAVIESLAADDQVLLTQLLAEPIDFIDDERFGKRGMDKELFGVETKLADKTATRFIRPNPVVQPKEGRGSRVPTLTGDQERLLFLRLNYARRAAGEILESSSGRRMTAHQTRTLLAWGYRALATRSEIVKFNLALVLAMAKRTRLQTIDYNELISEGNIALLRSVEKFDVGRGYKFSTYACRAILKSFSRVAMRVSRYRGRFPVEFDPTMERSDFLDKKRDRIEIDCVDEIKTILMKNLADLNEVEQTVISERFALLAALRAETPQPKTLEQVGVLIGVTKERVRQIEHGAMRKIKRSIIRQSGMKSSRLLFDA